MPKTISYEEFLVRSKTTQIEEYDYSTVTWVNTKTNITITCSKHGPFSQLPSSHMQGYGCPDCGRKLTTNAMASTQQDFLDKATSQRGTRYKLHKVVYTRSGKPVEFVCDDHGPFWMTPNKFLSGRDCPKCSVISTKERKRVQAEQKFLVDMEDNRDKCGYELIDYIDAHTNVEIICKAGHRNFWQSPSSHRSGSGCPECSKTGFNPSMPGILYILRSDNITKIGITNTSLHRRLKQIRRSSGKNFEILTFMTFENGQVVTDVETELLRLYRKTHKSPTQIYDGYSECFYDVDYNNLLLNVVKLCSELLSASIT